MGLWHLGTSDVGEVLEGMVRRMERHSCRSGLLRTFEDEAEAGGEGDPEGDHPFTLGCSWRMDREFPGA